MSVDACASEVLKRGLEDWVQAAEVVSVVRSFFSEASSADTRRIALEVIDQLLRDGLVTAGEVTNDGFAEWSMTSADAYRQILGCWRALGRDPELGEICWLSNTPRGDRRARLDIDDLAEG